MFKAHFLALWDPAISALVAASHGDRVADAALSRYLASWQDSGDWSALAHTLSRIRDGVRYDPSLYTGLGEVDTMIATRALDSLAGQVTISIALWPAMRFGTLLSDFVFGAATGDTPMVDAARRNLNTMATTEPNLTGLAQTLTEILEGNRDPGLAERFTDPFQRAVIDTVLYYIPLSVSEDPRTQWM
jgi:hypothetical protein